MKKLIFFVVIILSYTTISAQDASARSPKLKLEYKKNTESNIPLPKPEEKTNKVLIPILSAELIYKDKNSNLYLDANEEAEIRLIIKNKGGKDAQNCLLEVINNSSKSEVSISYNRQIGSIIKNDSTTAVIKIIGKENLSRGVITLTLKITEKDGFDLDPEKVITIPTREYQQPKIIVAEYNFQDDNRNNKLEKAEKFSFNITIRNDGENPAKNVKINFKPGENVLSLDGKNELIKNEINQGELLTFSTELITNNRVTTDISLKMVITEETGKYGFEKLFTIPLNIEQKKKDETIIAGKDSKTQIKDLEVIYSNKLDIAEDIPKASQIRSNAVAVVIGNKNYNKIFNVDFADNDARLVKHYLISALGFLEENIIYFEDASYSTMAAIFGKEGNHRGKLYDYLKPTGDGEIFVYYSGHGAPDTDTKQAFLVPIDCDPNLVSLNGFSLKTFYENLDLVATERKVKTLTVVLDACFSGNSEKGSILKNISPISITIEKDALKFEKAALFTSASKDQVSNWYPQKKQSLFTYLFLKGLKGDADYDNNNIITTSELHRYTADEINGVPYLSRRISSRTQNPEFRGVDYEIFR